VELQQDGQATPERSAARETFSPQPPVEAPTAQATAAHSSGERVGRVEEVVGVAQTDRSAERIEAWQDGYATVAGPEQEGRDEQGGGAKAAGGTRAQESG